jgi:alginate O-acetyltransferase complex protein AlgI
MPRGGVLNFTSPIYYLFVLITWIAFTCVAARQRWIVLLAASYLFLSTFCQPAAIIALAAVTIITYGSGLLLCSRTSIHEKRVVWILGIAINLALLIASKSTTILSGAASGVLGISPSTSGASWIVLIGLSYYVFQAISYLMDVYLERIPAERHLGHFSLYLAFFPKLLQGPIERAGTFLPQLAASPGIDPAAIREGLKLIVFGLFQKVVIADRLALYVDSVYGSRGNHQGWPLIIATYFYAMQIYCDFSGYTDIARGVARCFGINLMLNFRAPYLATSVADFWRRWHISLSSWILDYIFKPLQLRFRRVGKWGVAAALLIAFALCGLWHGFAMTYLVWGALQGALMGLSVLLKGKWAALCRKVRIPVWLPPDGLRMLVTFHLVCLSWVFFRSRTIHDAWYVITHFFVGLSPRNIPAAILLYTGESSSLGKFIVTCALLAFFVVIELWRFRSNGLPDFARVRALRVAFWIGISCMVLMLTLGSGKFIYQQF